MDKKTIDSSYGLNKIIWPIINEFQDILDRNPDNQEWKEARKFKNLATFIETIKNNEIITSYSDKYIDFFKKKTGKNLNKIETEKIRFGFIYSLLTHMDERRKVGGHYFNHLNSISIELRKSGWDIETIIGGFVHDTVEEKVKNIDLKDEKEVRKNIREIFINDYISSRKNFLSDFLNEDLSFKVKNSLDKIIEKYNEKTKFENKIENLDLIEDAIKKELEYGTRRIITKLSKSRKTSYQRYDNDLFNYELFKILKNKGKRHHQTNKNLNKLNRKNKGLKEIVEDELNEIIISNVNKSIAIKIEDRINNIETLNVVKYDLEEIVNEKKGIKKQGYNIIRNLSQLKNNFIEYCKISEDEIEKFANEGKDLSSRKKIFRKMGHELNKRHFVSGFITEPNYLKSWKNYIKNKIKGKKATSPVYTSFRHKDKINEYWKNIILIDRLNDYLSKYENKESDEYKRLKNRGEVLLETTMNQIQNDIVHTINWHINPEEYKYRRKETDNYLNLGKHRMVTKIDEESDLDGLTYVLNLNINKKEKRTIVPNKVDEIKYKLEYDRGYQYAALRGLKAILDNYKAGRSLKGLKF